MLHGDSAKGGEGRAHRRRAARLPLCGGAAELGSEDALATAAEGRGGGVEGGGVEGGRGLAHLLVARGVGSVDWAGV